MGLRDMLGRRNGGGDGIDEAGQLREQLTRQRWQSELLSEDLNRLELALEDKGWRKLALSMDREFTRGGLDDMVRLSRAMYLSHPLVQRAVNVRAYYVWGQGVEIAAADEQVQSEVVEPQMADDGNRAELWSHQAQMLTEIDQTLDGNVFLALFTGDRGDVAVRSIPAEEIRDIHTSPEDRQQVWYYRRVWSSEQLDPQTGRTRVEQREALYPDWRYTPRSQPSSIGGVEVRWDAPVIHQRTGGLKQMRFGVPETYAALDWARAYRKFLEDWHTIVSSLARFAWRLTTKGSKLKAAKDKLASTVTEDEPVEQTDPPAPGSIFMGSEGDQLTPIPKTGATTSAEDARPSRLMVGAAMDLPDTILTGDADVGNLATAKTLDRPTELAMRNRQTMWADLYRSILRYATDAKVRRDMLPGRVTRTPDGTVIEPAVDPSISVSFPSILEHDMESTVRAVVTAATLDGRAEAGTIPRQKLSELLLQAVGVEDVEAALDDLGDDTREALADAVGRLAEAVADGGGGDAR